MMDAGRGWARRRDTGELSSVEFFLSMISGGPGVGGINIPFLFRSLPPGLSRLFFFTSDYLAVAVKPGIAYLALVLTSISEITVALMLISPYYLRILLYLTEKTDTKD